MKALGMRVVLVLVVATGVLGLAGPAGATVDAPLELRISEDSPVLSEAVAITATVPRTLSARPTGTVAFVVDGTTTIGTVPLRASAVPRDTAVLWTRALPIGAHEVTAVYSGDRRYPATTSRPLRVRVERADTRTTLRSLLPEVVSGTTARFVARVAPIAPATAVPTGSITFKAGTVVRTVALVDGTATWRPRLPDGPYRVIARFVGDDSWATSEGPRVDQRIGPIPVPEVDQDVTSRAEQRLMLSAPGTFLAAAQVFTAGRTGTLTTLEVDAACFGGPPPGPGSGPLVPLTVKALSGESPTGAILATAGDPTGYDDATGLLRFDLATPVPVTQGSRYAIVVAAPQGAACDLGLAADGRSMVQSGSVWSAIGHTSLRFRTWILRP